MTYLYGFDHCWYLWIRVIIVAMGSANKRHCYNDTLSLIGLAHTQNDPDPVWLLLHCWTMVIAVFITVMS